MTISNVVPIDAVAFPSSPLPPLAAPSVAPTELANAAGGCSIAGEAAGADAGIVAGGSTETKATNPRSPAISVGKSSGEVAAPSSWNLFFLINETPPLAAS